MGTRTETEERRKDREGTKMTKAMMGLVPIAKRFLSMEMFLGDGRAQR